VRRARRARVGPRRTLRGRSAWIVRRDRRGVWFVVSFFVGFLLFMVVPLAYAIYTSMYTTRIIGGTVFAGASNYTQTLQSSQFWSGIVRVIIFGAIQIPLMLAIAFFFACVFDLGVAKFGRTFRTIFFIPFAVPAVVGAVMWSFLLEPPFGPFVHLAGAFGFHGVNILAVAAALGNHRDRDLGADRVQHDDPVHRAEVRAAGHGGGDHPRRHPAVEDHPADQAADGPPGRGHSGLPQHDRRAELFTEPQILEYFQQGSVSVSYTPAYYM
jgi:hypothetical protein